MRLNKLALALVLGGSALLSACGGGGSDTPAVSAGTKTASANTTATINATTGAAIAGALAGTTFSFASGVPLFGTTGATTVGVTNTGGTPGFAVGSSQGNASGGLGFGSCIFRVTAASTFAAGAPLASGNTVTVNPCSITLDTAGKPANGATTLTNVSFTLGTATSAGVGLNVAISADGAVSINGMTVAQIVLTAPTGATGSTGSTGAGG